MKPINAAAGLVFFIIAMSAGGRVHGGGNPNGFAVAFLAVMAVLLMMSAAVVVYRAATAAGRSIRKATQTVRQSPAAAALQPVHPLPDVIERLCQATGMVLVSREADRYQVRNSDHTRRQYIDIVYAESFASVLFQTWLPIKFSLEHEPKGLFARVLLRNLDLRWSCWAMTIGGSCEACLTLVTHLPHAALNAELFATVCREMVGEVNGFHQELRDKFRYEADGRVADSPRRASGHAGQRAGSRRFA